MTSIYLTHCYPKKDDSIKVSGAEVSPDKLYVQPLIQSFMNRCKKARVEWAIFSDKYGIFFPTDRHVWYDKHPDDVSPAEFTELVRKGVQDLKSYDIVYFYGNHDSPRFHSFYHKYINALKENQINVVRITHIDQIK